MWPVDAITIITARPVEVAKPSMVSEFCVFWFTTATAVPEKMSMSVPMNSAPTFLASETEGRVNEQETGGKLPSSKANASTVKHLQVLRGGPLWPFSLDISAMDPPNNEPSGVFGVEGAEGASQYPMSPFLPSS